MSSLLEQARQRLKNVEFNARVAAVTQCGDSSELNPPIPEDWQRAIDQARRDVENAQAGEARVAREENVLHHVIHISRKPPIR